MKRVAAAWRVLIGVWAPKKWEYSLTALAQYTATPIPPANQWVTGNSRVPAGGVARNLPFHRSHIAHGVPGQDG